MHVLYLSVGNLILCFRPCKNRISFFQNVMPVPQDTQRTAPVSQIGCDTVKIRLGSKILPSAIRNVWFHYLFIGKVKPAILLSYIKSGKPTSQVLSDLLRLPLRHDIFAKTPIKRTSRPIPAYVVKIHPMLSYILQLSRKLPIL